MDNNNNIFSETDYLKRNVEKDTDGKPEYSPMDPPDAYRPPNMEKVDYDLLPAFLKHLTDEHKLIMSELEKFEATLIEIRKEGVSKERNGKLGEFFKFLDEIIVLHHLKEERVLFPVLHDRLIDIGEKSQGDVPETAIDMLENDHIKTMQLTTLAFSLMGISSRLTDVSSRALLIDTSIEQSNLLIELLRLHIFREENVVLPLAVKHLNENDFQLMNDRLFKYFTEKV
ncbi:MAG: hemerythrin domain-containing protein [Bacteroidia bacterium]|nr:hemerythrin domain-containing protein [Bacteroidia bacterium]